MSAANMSRYKEKGVVMGVLALFPLPKSSDGASLLSHLLISKYRINPKSSGGIQKAILLYP
jgi:hypothetical protein